MIRALVLSLVAAAGVLCAWARADSSPEPFPFTRGTYWVYRGQVRYSTQGSESAMEAKVTWTTEIVRVLHRDGATAAIVKGFPDDLAWSTGNTEPRETMIVRASDDRFYLVDPERARTVENKFTDTHAALRDFLREDDLWFQWPLAAREKFCSEDVAKREDEMYCWIVDTPIEVSLDGIIGLARKSATAIPLRYLTNPDSTYFELVSGVGILRYEYHHHGTVADTELKLVEFHPAP